MINSSVLSGRLTADPQSKEITTAKGPVRVVSFGFAVRRFGKEDPLYVNVSIFGKSGDFAMNYLKKGAAATIQGSISDVRAYVGKDGQAKASLEFRADNIDSPNTAGSTAGVSSAGQATDTNGNVTAVADSEIPF
jgi:single-stranded DNA-binding protein